MSRDDEFPDGTGSPDTFADKATAVGVLATKNEDARSLRELLVYGLKGIAAYADHAAILDHEDSAIYNPMFDALASTTDDLSQDGMVAMVMVRVAHGWQFGPNTQQTPLSGQAV